MVALAAQPLAAATAKPLQSYYSVQVLIEMVNAGDLRDNGIQMTLADAKSIRVGNPQRHGLTVYQKDGVSKMKLPPCPRGVDVPVQGMLGPNTASNVTDNASWVFSAIVVAKTAAAKKPAADHGARLLCSLLDQGLMNVNMTIPASATHGEIKLESKHAGERVQVTRQFATQSSTLSIKELVNVHIAVADNMPPSAKKILSAFASKYSKIITTATCKPNSNIKDTLPAMGKLDDKNAVGYPSGGKGKSKPLAKVKKVMKSSMKRLTRR